MPRSPLLSIVIVGLAGPLAGCGGGLVINEFMASNASTATDESGANPDWIELHNLGSSAVSLDGFYISDDLAEPDREPLDGSLSVPAGGYLILFADGDVDQGANHLSFRLAKAGEDVVLSTDGESAVEVVDSTTYGEQQTDVSMARSPDGTGDFAASDSPTPGAANE